MIKNVNKILILEKSNLGISITHKASYVNYIRITKSFPDDERFVGLIDKFSVKLVLGPPELVRPAMA